MIGHVPPAVREALDWLDFTAEEKDQLSNMYSLSSFVSTHYEDSGDIVKSIEQCSIEVGHLLNAKDEPWLEFLRRRVGTEDELRFILGEESPLFPGKGYLGEPNLYIYLTYELLMGELAPSSIYELWQEQLVLAQGDGVQAMVALEFLRPVTV